MKKVKMGVTSLIAIALIFGLGGLSLLSYFKTKELLMDNLEMHISSLTLSSGSEVGFWLDTRKTEIEIMANTPSIQSGDKSAIVSYLSKEVERNKDFEDIFVADKLGNYYLSSGFGGNIADRDYFQKVITTGEPIISDPLISRGSGNYSIMLAAPIIIKDKVVGLLGGTVNLTKITHLVTSNKVGEIGEAFMIQQDGLMIAHPNRELIMNSNILKENDVSRSYQDAIHKMVRGETGVTKYSYENEDKYLAFAPVPGVKWSLGVTVPLVYITNQLSYLPFYFIGVTLFIGIILVFLLSRWLVVPLTTLTKFTTELNHNINEPVVNYNLDSPVLEVQSLTTNFQWMVEALQESFLELENSKLHLKGEIIEKTKVQINLERSYGELGATEEELRFNYEKLQSKEKLLRESERRLRSILENVQLITGIMDKDGRILFCNDFILELSGFKREEVMGRSFFDIFVPSELRESANAWFQEVLNSKMIIVHNVYPIQTKNGFKRYVNWNHTLLFDADGNVSGVASIGEDITERKQFQEKLEHMSFHDALTNLYNRTFFEEKIRLLRGDDYAPIGLIVCDVDGLKLVNDTLGHNTGDKLLWLTAGIIKKCFREDDLVFRIGGDEFAILLPKSDMEIVEQACYRIRKAVEEYNIENVELPLSLSIGFAVSEETNVDVDMVFKEADDGMYREKLHRTKSTRSSIVQALMKALEARDFITEGHADRLQDIVLTIGEAMGLSERVLADLRLLAQFHDIGKVGIPDRILFKPGRLTNEEFKEMQRHSEIGNRIAQSAPDLLPIADHILRHHEWWNGQGYPLGLKENEIPIECRILAIADAYDAMTSNRPYRKAMSQEQAFYELMEYSGVQFDPNLVPLFIKVIRFSLKGIDL
ncbi:Adenylate/guanylate cyclase [Desulfosporosinus sp. I2]|uniref:HD domain-containing phosphohydrolase n=1 Tax=Desulfosporosinus sp. I2 TaxID=1617025 RepID=UPI0005F00C76|nr:HD domain-containing phosphohydrolase [Desulfosporosinus sp. I2]KJR46967.1 Adenylate/guanylate cyclase [Desulfosporosinus sp. I2]